MPVLQRPFWNGDPEELRELFALSKSDRAHARCALWSHQFSWEVRLTVNGSLIRSQVSRDYAEVLTAAEEWRRAMREEGWRLTVPKRGRTDQGSIITGHQAWDKSYDKLMWDYTKQWLVPEGLQPAIDKAIDEPANRKSDFSKLVQ